jgi:hypothetical protein
MFASHDIARFSVDHTSFFAVRVEVETILADAAVDEVNVNNHQVSF